MIMKRISYISCTGLLLLSVFSSPCFSSSKECVEKEKSLALLELAKDSITKAKELIPHCEEEISENVLNKTTCGKKEKLEAHIDITLKLIDEAKENYPTCDFNKDKEAKPRPGNCLELQQRGFNKSGVYTIRLNHITARNKSINVFCDMDTDGGGWTVIQRRGNFAPLEEFYRDWEDYKNGFGNISRDFWIGNDNIFFLTNSSRSKIRFDISDISGERRYAVYDYFSIEGVQDKYKLRISNYSGNAGDTMEKHNGQLFSTHDNANDISDDQRCAVYKRGGWWYYSCADCNPNGAYVPGESDMTSMYWWTWQGYIGMKTTEIKLKPFI